MVKVRTYIHCFAVNNWREIMAEFARKIAASNHRFEVFVGFTGTPEESGYVWHLFKAFGIDVKIFFVDGAKWEFETLDEMQKDSADFDMGLYIHTKGVSRPNHWVSTMWRWFMNWQIFGADLTDLALRRDWDFAAPMISSHGEHSVGNFFYVRGGHMKCLPPMSEWVQVWQQRTHTLWLKARHAAEFYVGCRGGIGIQLHEFGFPIYSHNWWAQQPEFQQKVILHGS